jgi:hypothetical protein
LPKWAPLWADRANPGTRKNDASSLGSGRRREGACGEVARRLWLRHGCRRLAPPHYAEQDHRPCHETARGPRQRNSAAPRYLPRDGGCFTRPPEGLEGQGLPRRAGSASRAESILRRSAEPKPIFDGCRRPTDVSSSQEMGQKRPFYRCEVGAGRDTMAVATTTIGRLTDSEHSA